MAGCGGFRSMANPKCIGTILVIFVTINVIFYKFRLDKKLDFLENPSITNGMSGNGPKSLMLGDALRGFHDFRVNWTTNDPASNSSAIRTFLKFKGLEKTSYNAGDIPKLLDALKSIQEHVDKEENPKSKELPKCKPQHLGSMKPVETDITKIPDDLSKKYPEVYGGLWRPQSCHPAHRTALLIPYRNRTTNLKIFLNHIHRFLQTQLLDYGVFVIEQADTKRFNRAKLLNVGYVEAQKFHGYDCFILHDIDKIPEDTRNIYTCDKKPKHLISQRHTQKDDKYKPGMLYYWYFGGATSISNANYRQINGMSNRYWGWGREDDDFAARVRVRGLGGIFPRGEEGRYLVLDHHDDRVENSMKWPYMNVVKQQMVKDGLNSLNYTIKNIAVEPLYTKISVLL